MDTTQKRSTHTPDWMAFVALGGLFWMVATASVTFLFIPEKHYKLWLVLFKLSLFALTIAILHTFVGWFALAFFAFVLACGIFTMLALETINGEYGYSSERIYDY